MVRPTVDDATLKRAAAGDFVAFENIVSAYERLVYSLARRMLGNAEDAQDVSQETMLKVFRNLDKCQSAAVLRGWICRIAHNTCIDHIRKAKNRETLSYDAPLTDEDGEFSTLMPSAAASPEEAVLAGERRGMIIDALSLLPYDQRLLVVLRDIHGLSYEELAETTSAGLGTVKSRLSRARTAMRGELRRLGFRPEQKSGGRRFIE